jgi:hypothetical protein
VNAVGSAVGGIDEAVAGEIQRQVAPELLWRRVADELAVRIVGGDLRQLVTLRAPPALEREGVHVEDHHASAQVVVGHVHLARRFIQANLLWCGL